MKKVLALVLALVMMTSLAFAIDIGNGGNTANNDYQVNPGAKINIFVDAFKDDNQAQIAAGVPFTSEYFNITKKTFDKGSALVESITWNDEKECIVIQLKQDYEKLVDYVGAYNLVIKDLVVKAKKAYKDNTGTTLLSKNATYTYVGDSNYAKDFRYGYDPRVIVLDTDSIELTQSATEKGLVMFLSKGDVQAKATDKGYTNVYSPNSNPDDAAYTEVSLSIADIAYLSGRVYKNDVVYLSYDEDVDLDIVKAYPDADLRFVNLMNTPAFNANMDFELYADEDTFLYEVKDGKLVKSNLKWDDDVYAFTGKLRTLGEYVISDIELDVAADTDSTADPNPDTGANDVVGIAGALAVVALVSAAAVSLKK